MFLVLSFIGMVLLRAFWLSPDGLALSVRKFKWNGLRRVGIRALVTAMVDDRLKAEAWGAFAARCAEGSLIERAGQWEALAGRP
jgi:hypothetical protein